MNKEQVEWLRSELVVRYLFVFLFEGLKAIIHSIWKVSFLVMLNIGVVLWQVLSSGTQIRIGEIMLVSALLIVPITVIWALLSAVPRGFLSINHKMARTELANSLGERPVLVKRDKNGAYETWTFDTYAVGLSRFHECIESIEAALDVAISTMYPGDIGHQVKMELVYHPGPWPNMLPWSMDKISEHLSTLLLGENRGIPIRVNLAVIPHLYIASRSGGGKSSLLKVIMAQAIYKGWDVRLIDYKRAVDYSKVWKNHLDIVSTDEDTLAILEDVNNEMERRLALLENDGVANVDEYNAVFDTDIRRTLLVFDEVTACLTKTNASKEKRAFIDEASRLLSRLCMLGRAAGISVILSTQRAGADVLPGEVRANVYSICGIADNVLSVMVLGNGDADKRIPKNARGRFVTEEGTMFQGYFVQEKLDIFSELEFELIDL